MKRTVVDTARFAPFAAGLVLSCLSVASALATEACGLCNTEIVTNSELAGCFLKEYQSLAQTDGAVVVVDLSACETSRGGLEALPGPTDGPAQEPDTQFMIPRAQLDCLKAKLEAPGLVLDPSARIELASCG